MPERLEIAQARGLGADGPLQRKADPLMQLAAPGEEQILVDRLAHEGVGELVAAAALAALRQRLDQIAVREPAEPGRDAVRTGRDGAKQGLLECHAKHGGLLEQAPVVGWQPIDPGQEKTLQGRRNVHSLAVLSAAPAIALADQDALVDEAAYHLLDEQGIAVGPRRDQPLDAGKGSFIRPAEQAADQLGRFLPGEPGQPELRPLGLRDGHPACLRTQRDQDHQRPSGQVVGDVTKQVERGGIGPVQILHDEQNRPLIEAPLDQRARRQRDLALDLLGIEIGIPGAGFPQAQQVAQHRHHRLRDLERRPEGAETGCELLPCDLERVFRRDLITVAKQGGEGAVGRLAERRAAMAADRGRGQLRIVPDPAQELGNQPRLAGAGLAGHAHQLRPATLRPAKRVEQLPELADAPHHRRFEAV
jgi:hypothetical protein